MKVLGKRFLSLLLTAIFIISMIFTVSFSVTGASYNASSAISYANAHWNDGVGLCAEFVSKCLNAGGITIPNKAYYSSSQKSYANNSGTLGSYTNPYTCSAALLLYLSERYTVITNPSSSQISVGDVVFMYGGTNSQWKDGHVGIVISNSNNTPIYAAHNKATNTGKFSSSYPCTYVAKMNGTLDNLTKLTKYPTPIYAQTKATGKTTVYSYPNSSAIDNKIYDTDLCTIKAIYTNGWCKVTFPLDAGGTDSGYVKTSVFFDPSYDIFKITAGAEITTYPRSNLSGSFGYTGSGDTIYTIGHTSSAVQILYPLTSGGYKAGWVPISYFTFNIKYNANGGTGTMSSSTVKFQNKLTLATNKFTKTGHTISGWNCYRSSDKTWSVKGGWKTASQISNNNLSKYLYPTSTSGTLEESWLTGGKTKDTFTFYAIWKANTLSVYYNANGASISSDTYKLSNNLIYNKSDSSKFVQTWTYNTKKSNGLTNCGTFGLSKTGHHFKGWGTSSSGGTIFDHNNIDLLPETINNKLKSENCSSTLYAIWEPNTLNIYYKANGGTITSDTYILSNDYVYTKSNSTKLADAWTYNSTKTNGLYNAKTFGLARDGYKFVGWSAKADGTGTIFNQDNTTIVPTDITATIKTSNCTLDLYAIWEKDATEPPTEKPTETPTEKQTEAETVIPTQINTEPPTIVETLPPTEVPTIEVTEENTEIETVIPTEAEFTIGDVDLDGNITIMDATLIQRAIAKAVSLTDKQSLVADTDRDSKISVMDVTLIQRYIAKAITSF